MYGTALSHAIASCHLPSMIIEQLITAVACSGTNFRPVIHSTVVRLVRIKPAVVDDMFGLIANPPEGPDPRLIRYEPPLIGEFLIVSGCWV